VDKEELQVLHKLVCRRLADAQLVEHRAETV